MMKFYGGVETGGTKFVCMVARGPENVVAETVFPTTTPEATLNRAVAFFREQMNVFELEALGIGTFGPVDLNAGSPTFGTITTTPKPGWSNVDLVGKFKHELHLPVAIDTDVNAAALGENLWGNAVGKDPCVYFTIGTGIGMGGRINQFLLHGLTHPEAGHMILQRDARQDPFEGSCTYHGDCFEGLASGLAVERRCGQRGETLPDEHPAWKLEAHYIAQALVNTILMLSPQRIVLGGGIMERRHLFPMIRADVVALLKGYVQAKEITEQIDDFIVPAKLGKQAGVLGAIGLAAQAAGLGEPAC
jgi:fructokinase